MRKKWKRMSTGDMCTHVHDSQGAGAAPTSVSGQHARDGVLLDGKRSKARSCTIRRHQPEGTRPKR